MRSPAPPLRRARPLAAAALTATAVTLALSACGSPAHHTNGTGTPAGLNGTETGVAAGSQYAAESKSAATALTPLRGSFLAGKTSVSFLGSTTPANGDINPYAIWPVTHTVGSLTTGDVLVDNFNNASNNQGTGTTIVVLHKNGDFGVFATLPRTEPGCTGGIGLTTAMVQLRTGWVIVGSLPSQNGQISTAGAGCLLVLSPTGKLARVISGAYLDGPWDAAVADHGDTATLFVTNTLVGLEKSKSAPEVDKGDVVRLSLAQTATSAPRVTAETTVASGFGERPDAAAFVKGPTGLALSPSGTLYVGDNLGNRIATVPDALGRTTSDGTGTTLSYGGQLANPLGIATAPDGDLLVANATNGKIVELTPAGRQVGEYYADDDIGQEPAGNGDLFDVAVNQAGTGVLFVNDATNTLELLHS